MDRLAPGAVKVGMASGPLPPQNCSVLCLSALSTGRSSREMTRDGPSIRRTGPASRSRSRSSSCRGRGGAQVGPGDGVAAATAWGGALDPGSRQGGPWLPRVVACRLPLSHNSQAWPGHAVLGANRALSTSLAAFHAAPDGRRGHAHGRKPPCHRWFGFWVLKPVFKQMEKPRHEKLIG